MLSSRAIIVASLALWAVHAVSVTFYGDGPGGSVISSVMQLAIGALCVIAASKAALTEGASRFERRFLALVAIRYLIFWGVAQGLATHYEYRGDIEFAGSAADVLFHLENVPLGIAFFLHPGGSDRLARPRLVDLAQIVVLWIAVSLYIRYMTTSADGGVGLLTGTNAFVAGCFYLRSLTSRSTMASAMFGRWTPAILLSTVNDGYAGFYNSYAGGPFDLVWSLELVVWTLTAATWRPATVEPLETRPTVDRTVYLLPLVVSCFSVVLALGTAPRQPVMAALLITAALALSAAGILWRRTLGSNASSTGR